jgi:hypothetical protein
MTASVSAASPVTVVRRTSTALMPSSKPSTWSAA